MPESETPVRSGVASLVFLALIGIISTTPNVPLDVSPVLISGLVMMLVTTAAHFIQHTLFVDGPPPKVTSTTLAPAPTPALLLARANILKLSPYRCARDDYTSGVLLDANENSLGPSLSPRPSKGKGASSLALERYPDPHQVELKSAFAELRSATIPTATATFGPLPPRVLTHRNIFAGVGSDEAIDLLIRIFASPGPPPRGDSVLITPPTYGMYEVCSDVNDVTVLRAPLTAFDFDLDVEVTVRTALKHASKLVFICSPGNPTAKAIDLDKITAVATALRDTSIVVVDEAYVDFSGKQSAVQLIFDHPNVVVLQTLSKAFGLAGGEWSLAELATLSNSECLKTLCVGVALEFCVGVLRWSSALELWSLVICLFLSFLPFLH